MARVVQSLPEGLKPGRLQAAVPLARFTAARLGGPAEWLYSARDSRRELEAALRLALERGIPFRTLGGGANVLIADAGLPGLVLVNRVQEVEFGENWLRASAGSGLMALARLCQARGLAGMEWAVSVPGTLGGAVINNAGAHGGDMAGILREALLLEAEGNLRRLTVGELAYAYRHSRSARSGTGCCWKQRWRCSPMIRNVSLRAWRNSAPPANAVSRRAPVWGASFATRRETSPAG